MRSSCSIPRSPSGSAPRSRRRRRRSAGLAGDRARRIDADPRADRQRQDADRVPLVHQPADVRRGAAAPSARCRVLYISPLKALAVDIERNLRAPLAGIANRAAARGDAFHLPAIAIRTGDTPAIERARFQREPADILITTPESLYLLLTSNAREALRSVDTVIVDEIHALVPTKRGAHLALSLERLEAAPPAARDAPVQRIGLSATQRPLDEVARFLGGTLATAAAPAVAGSRKRPTRHGRRAADPRPPIPTTPFTTSSPPRRRRRRRIRPVTIVDTSEKKKLELTIEVPVEDMAKIGQLEEIPSGAGVAGAGPHVDLDGDPPAAARARARAPLDADLRQQPPHRRAAGGRAQRARRRSARPLAPRLARAAAADRGRGPAEGRADPRPRRHLVARARHRHGRDRSRHPDRGAAVGRERHAAHRPRRPHHRRRQPRRHRPEVPRRSRRVRRGDARDARGARSSRAATRATRSTCSRSRSSRWWRWTTGTSTRCSTRSGSAAPFAELSRAVFEGVLDMLSGRYPVRRLRRPAPAPDVGSAEGHADRARRRQARRRDQRRHDSRSRPLRRVPRSASADRRRASASSTKRWCSRAASARRSCSAPRRWRIEEITHDRVLVSPAPGRAGQDAVLEGGRGGPAAGARTAHRRAGADPAAHAAGRGDPAARPATTISTSRRPRTCCAISPIRRPPPASCPTTARS